jgi:hypothetical protein
MNAAAREYASPLLEEPWRNLDDSAVKWAWQEPATGELYRYVQEGSRLLEGRGAGLLRKDIGEIREAAGEPSWADLRATEPVA